MNPLMTFMNFTTKTGFFFDEALADKIDEFKDLFFEILVEFKNSKKSSDDGRGIIYDKQIKIWDKMEKNIPVIRKEIETEFRKIIGVE